MFYNGVFPLGKVEPSVREHSLKFERKYYKVAEGRVAITEDKVSDENARLLTMVAMAKELSVIGVAKAEVILAVGLPFSDYGREKKGLVQYYEQKMVLKYEFVGVKYDVAISRVLVFPQCYSAIARHKKITNSREKTERKQGAQTGHKHHGRKKQTPTKLISAAFAISSSVIFSL